MAQVTKKEIISYLDQLQKVYSVVGLQDKRLNEIIKCLSSNEPKNTLTTTTHKKESPFGETLKLFLQKKYDDMKGTKINYEQVTTSEDVMEYINIHSENEILTHTTKLDLKLLYSILTEEHRELKGNKSDMLQTIKRNIRARKRGEAFSK